MKRPGTNSDPQALERIVRELLRRKEPVWTERDVDLLKERLDAALPEPRAGRPARWQDPLIERAVPAGASVLDLGCGTGELLQRLMRDKQVRAQGVEFAAEAVRACIDRGVPVLQCDLDAGLRGFADASFDVVVLEETLQTLHRPIQMLDEMLRVGCRSVVSFPNFGSWRIRLSLGIDGHMPVTDRLPYRWHDTPNIHLFTIRDFLAWVDETGVTISDAYALRGHDVTPLQEEDNLLADEALFFLQKG